jgi:hypothetical protein
VAAACAAAAARGAAGCHLAERAAVAPEDSTWAGPTLPVAEWEAVQCSGPALHSGPAELANPGGRAESGELEELADLAAPEGPAALEHPAAQEDPALQAESGALVEQADPAGPVVQAEPAEIGPGTEAAPAEAITSLTVAGETPS